MVRRKGLFTKRCTPVGAASNGGALGSDFLGIVPMPPAVNGPLTRPARQELALGALGKYGLQHTRM